MEENVFEPPVERQRECVVACKQVKPWGGPCSCPLLTAPSALQLGQYQVLVRQLTCP